MRIEVDALRVAPGAPLSLAAPPTRVEPARGPKADRAAFLADAPK
jgi:hypothetical protein